MATIDIVPQESSGQLGQQRVVNDMSIQVATVNGSGSQSSNTVLLRSIFQMGVPISGKNMFPSNIAGLPTWYTIRASKDGYIARKKEIDLLIAMNAETAQDDVKTLAPGASVIYDEPLALDKVRDDLVYYPVPFDKLAATVGAEAKLRKLIKNMIYVGVAAQLLEIDYTEVEKAIRKQFATKAKAAALNLAAAKAGHDYAIANLKKRDPFCIQRMDKTKGKIIVDGNSAAAMGCMFAGCTVVTWYPITPSSSLVETMIDYMKEYRVGPDGKATFAIVQAEDELAAVGGGAIDDCNRWARHLADGGVCGLGVLRGGSGGDLEHSAGGPIDRFADSHGAGRRALDGVPQSWRYEAHHAVPGFDDRVLHHGAGCVRFGGALSDAGVCHVGPRLGNE